MASITGRVEVAPWIKVSKAGTPYSEFVIMDSKNKSHHCIGFNAVAQKLEKELSINQKLTVMGQLKDDKFFVSSFTTATQSEGQDIQRYKTPEPKVTEIDILMDILTPKYVSRRMREFFHTGDIRKVIGGFDLPGYKKLVQQLKIEAAFVKEEAWLMYLFKPSFTITVDQKDF